jgi:prolyl-tRNA editing enzyme YbaK/EbsC (Cys-tRNA(Pro) deacylase)
VDAGVHDRIVSLLKEHDVSFRELHHEPTRTSEESARIRGEALKNGGKAILLKVDTSFALFVLSGAARLESSLVKKHFKVKRLRFATKDELLEQTGLVPGAVPPFGRPIFDMDLFVDNSIIENDRIAFNAGSLTDSIIMAVHDYMGIAKPTVFPFSAPAELPPQGCTNG